MRAVRSRDTSPELAVRRLLRDQGLNGYRLHRKELPGKPDVTFVGRKKAIFIHGCFWHGHACRRGNRMPATNVDYWLKKIGRNKLRDRKHLAELARLGWSTLTVWECELNNAEVLSAKLRHFVASPPSHI